MQPLDLGPDAPGDITCSCPDCDWTSWARTFAEQARKEQEHDRQEHPETDRR